MTWISTIFRTFLSPRFSPAVFLRGKARKNSNCPKNCSDSYLSHVSFFYIDHFSINFEKNFLLQTFFKLFPNDSKALKRLSKGIHSRSKLPIVYDKPILLNGCIDHVLYAFEPRNIHENGIMNYLLLVTETLKKRIYPNPYP